jgi:hypothetical protein
MSMSNRGKLPVMRVWILDVELLEIQVTQRVLELIENTRNEF